MYRIFLVEDDIALANTMKQQLEAYGNDVCLAADFHHIVDDFKMYDPQLVLMDLMLPYRDGYFWCGEIRKISSVPVMFISSASDSMNIVMAISMGGDDFIPKPVDAMVLNAKVQALLRRVYEVTSGSSFISFYGARLSLNDGSIMIGEKRIELTKNEFRILQFLLENRGKIVSRNKLMTKLWQDDCYVEENTLTVNVARLRRKLEENGLKDVVVTKPGSGYLIK